MHAGGSRLYDPDTIGERSGEPHAAGTGAAFARTGGRVMRPHARVVPGARTRYPRCEETSVSPARRMRTRHAMSATPAAAYNVTSGSIGTRSRSAPQ